MVDQPQTVAGLVLMGIRDVVGGAEVNRLRTFPEVAEFARVTDHLTPPLASGLQRRLENEFTPAAGRGICQRAGEAVALELIRQNGEALGFNAFIFRSQPWRKRLRTGLERLAAHCSDWFGSEVSVRSDEDCLIWHVANCPWCWQRHAENAICTFFTGFVVGYLGFASGGRFFRVNETTCCGSGGESCEFEIIKRPLE
ncbi:MAG: hypothetical protein HPY76_07650 [Anaerolineae bacterium]|nr:hypothetical protein [Anaerolineae bacterium]